MNSADKRETSWQVDFTRKAQKQADNLPNAINDTLFVLKDELEVEGPVQTEWHHYGRLAGKKREYHHCHLNKGHPRYVAVWVVEDRVKQIIEICFADTHEKVDYALFK
jgi:mRNA-degrading endonuclease RelE of RelBE toxin-antitoxin system